MRLGAVFLLSLALGCGSTMETSSAPPPPAPPPAPLSMPPSRTVVTGSTVNLRQGPGTIYAVLGRVHRGDTLVVVGEAEDWYRVYLPGLSLFAWISAGLTTGADLP